MTYLHEHLPLSKLLHSFLNQHPLPNCLRNLRISIDLLLHVRQRLLSQFLRQHHHAVHISDDIVAGVDGDVLILRVELDGNVCSSDLGDLTRRGGSNVAGEDLMGLLDALFAYGSWNGAYGEVLLALLLQISEATIDD